MMAASLLDYTANPFAHQEDDACELEDLFPQPLQALDPTLPPSGAAASASAADAPQHILAKQQQQRLSSDVELSPNDAWALFGSGLQLELESGAAAALQQYECACVLEPYEETFVFYAADARFRLYRDVETAVETVKWLWSGGAGLGQGRALACRLASSVAVYCCERGWWAGVLGALEAVTGGRGDDDGAGDGGDALARAELVGVVGVVNGDNANVGPKDAIVTTKCQDDGTAHDVGMLVALADGGASARDVLDGDDSGRSESGQHEPAWGLESYNGADDSLNDYDGDVNHDQRDATADTARREGVMDEVEAVNDGSGGSARADGRAEFASYIREDKGHMVGSRQQTAALDIVSSETALYDGAPCGVEGEGGGGMSQGEAAIATTCGDGAADFVEAVGDDIAGSEPTEGRGDTARYAPENTGQTTVPGQQTAAVDVVYNEGNGDCYDGAQSGVEDGGGRYESQGEAVGTISEDGIVGINDGSAGSAHAVPAGWASDVRVGNGGDMFEQKDRGVTIRTRCQEDDAEFHGGALVVRDDEGDHGAGQDDASLRLICADDGVDVLNAEIGSSGRFARGESGSAARNVRGSSGDAANEFIQLGAIVCTEEDAAIDDSGDVALLSQATASVDPGESGAVVNCNGGRRVRQEDRGVCQVGREARLAEGVAYVALGRREDAVRALEVLIRTARDEEERRMLDEMREEMIQEGALLSH